MKRLTIIAALTLSLLPSVVSADLSGTDRQRRDDARCARVGEVFARKGYTERELASLKRRNCKELNGRWVSALYYQA